MTVLAANFLRPFSGFFYLLYYVFPITIELGQHLKYHITKTTLLKLLLKINPQYEGEIRVGASVPLSFGEGLGVRRSLRFENISPSYWCQMCGAVMQEGFIFNDTIAGNIAVGEENIEYNRLLDSCETANILSFIESLPNGFYTELGSGGVGLSQGQKQRLLIARAVYKNRDYLFFDEATN